MEPLTFSLPGTPADVERWYRMIDTSRNPPEDFIEGWTEPVMSNTYAA
ncbi:hypothetical protein [Edaphobacter aggregans]|nr:hypothetical protein [Edaphobacter aggregans]